MSISYIEKSDPPKNNPWWVLLFGSGNHYYEILLNFLRVDVSYCYLGVF